MVDGRFYPVSSGERSDGLMQLSLPTVKQVPLSLSGQILSLPVALSTLQMTVYIVRLCIRKVFVIFCRPPVGALPHCGAMVKYLYV